MATAYPLTTRASGPSVLIIEKQQGQWDQQYPVLKSIDCKLQTVASCALATASTAVMEVSNFSKVLLLWNVAAAQAAYMG